MLRLVGVLTARRWSLVQLSGIPSAFVLALAEFASAGVQQSPPRLAEPTSSNYCSDVQRVLANSSVRGMNTLFTSMPEYRHSKPAINPLRTYQVVTYAGSLPIVVSCKVKSAAQIRAVYGVSAAGRQLFCWDIARLTRNEAVAELRQQGNSAAAARAAAFIIDRIEPYVTGQAYLSDFQAIYRDRNGALHLNSPGLFQDFDSWFTTLLPSVLQGQSYCHLATVAYIKAVAAGVMQPGTKITSDDDAPVRPR